MKKGFARTIVLDFETAWDRATYSLSHMTTEEYIRDKRFKAWGCSYRWMDTKDAPRWVTGKDLPTFFGSIDWSTTAALAHNAQFDLAILAWRYGHIPAVCFDSLSMARALRGVEVGNSLATLAEDFKLPPKGNAVYSTDGMLDTLPPEVEEELARYCCHDTYLCEEIFRRLSPGYPVKELRLIDMTQRMFLKPVLQLDKSMLVEAILDERTRREGLLKRLGVDERYLASNDRFVALLEMLGVTVPMKTSKTTGKEAPALAKSDAGFQALLNSSQEDVVLLCEARLAVKSTQERTRAQRFLDIAHRGALPVPLNYYAAHTGRWGGSRGSNLNLQNLKRGSFLRNAIMAPEGHSLVVGDLSQIEVRVLAAIVRNERLLRVFQTGGDPYAEFGATMFNIPGMTKDTHPVLRQSAKSALLGCGFGLGWRSFAAQLLTGFLGAPPVRYDVAFLQQIGLDAANVMRAMDDTEFMEQVATIPHNCTDDELLVHAVAVRELVTIYRHSSPQEVRFWRSLGECIDRHLANKDTHPRNPRILYGLEFSFERIKLPSGLSLRYPELQFTLDGQGRGQWSYNSGKTGRTKLYGGKLTENIVQAVARCIMTDGLLRVQERYPCVLTVHDEGVFLVPDNEVAEAVPWIKACMTRVPGYLPNIPMGATVSAAKRYGEAK